VVSVFVTGPKDRGFKPGWGDEYLTAIKIRTVPSFARKQKPDFQYRKILRDVKYHLQVWTKSLQGKILYPFIHSSYFLQDDSAGRIAREL
jgi:hypothetical protein